MKEEGTMNNQLEFEIKAFKSMLESCYAYDNLSKEDRYVKPYKAKLGVELFDKIYEEQHKYLNETFYVKRNVHTDHEGCTYNSLIKIENDEEK